MKICWDNLEGFYLTRNGFLRKASTTYIERPSCKRCGDSYLTVRTRQSDYCGISCLKKSMVMSEETKRKMSEATSGEKHPWFGKKHTAKSKEKMSKSSIGKKHTKESKLKMSVSRSGSKNHFYGKHHSEETKQKLSESHIGLSSGEKNPAYKGGVTVLNVPLYETYAEQLNWCESTRCVLQNGLKILQVKCFYNQCQKWYTPSIAHVVNRIQIIKDNRGGNGNFYCSEECKRKCSIYNVSINQMMSTKDGLQNIGNELRTWREEVLRRADYKCEYCGTEANIAHHIRPKKLEPFFALDPDYGLACCEECHYKYAHQGECSTGYLANIKCQ
jgi:hypothetical protein